MSNTMKYVSLFVMGLAVSATPSALAEASKMPTCSPVSVSVYFQPGEVSMSSASKSLLQHVNKSFEGCGIEKVSVQGMADAFGSDDINAYLRLARAEQAVEYLVSENIVAQDGVEIALQSTDSNGDGVADVMARKADIIFIPKSGVGAVI